MGVVFKWVQLLSGGFHFSGVFLFRTFLTVYVLVLRLWMFNDILIISYQSVWNMTTGGNNTDLPQATEKICKYHICQPWAGIESCIEKYLAMVKNQAHNLSG